MTLIDCPECKKIISSAAISCPHCGVPLVCPECGRKHPPLEVRMPPNNAQRPIRRVALGLMLIAMPLLAWGLYWRISHTEHPVAPPPVAAQSLSEQTILRVAGSGVLASKLVSALAEAYLRHEGARDVWYAPSQALGKITIQGKFPAENTVKTIEISSPDPESAWENLGAGQADLSLSAGRVKSEDVAKLRLSGDTATALEEHALAADSLAIIVYRDNPVSALSKDQIAAIFSGIVTDWRQVKQKPGHINVYVPDDGAESFDSFHSLLPSIRGLAVNAVAYKDPSQISEAVAKDVNGIGIVAMPYVGEARAVPVAEANATQVFPSSPNVARGIYPLARRLYLYNLKDHNNLHVKGFVDFTASQAGQDLIHQKGLVALGSWAGKADVAGTSDDEYTRLTTDALHLSFDIHFRYASGELDDAARINIARAKEFLNEIGREDYTIMVFGFSDAHGNRSSNPRFSMMRAQRVARELKRYGIISAVVRGVGSRQPVASNDTEEGRSRNRRVELWLKRENQSSAEYQSSQP